ncbi:Dr family adhesin structural subunit [Salmonella enterica subsp. enterica]|nr:Dr family adhesin structural subunit [Salmonella enterica subsp. enterica]
MKKQIIAACLITAGSLGTAYADAVMPAQVATANVTVTFNVLASSCWQASPVTVNVDPLNPSAKPLVLKVTNCGNSAQQLSVSADQSHTGSSAGFIAINDSTKAQLQIGAPAGDGWTRETDGSYYNSTPTPANGNIDVSLSVTQSAATMPAPGDYTLPLTLKTKGA